MNKIIETLVRKAFKKEFDELYSEEQRRIDNQTERMASRLTAEIYRKGIINRILTNYSDAIILYIGKDNENKEAIVFVSNNDISLSFLFYLFVAFSLKTLLLIKKPKMNLRFLFLLTIYYLFSADNRFCIYSRTEQLYP